jgi:WhiB family redox-sensing transcriptional regulator
MELGACRSANARLFFAPEEKEARELRFERERQAKAVCADCIVQDECLAYALRNRERIGVWGGLTEVERSARY